MSLDAMLAVFKLPPRSCTTSERLLLLAMAESASETGELSAYARSQAFMAFKCGFLQTESVRQLQRSLEKKGLLLCRARGSSDGRQGDFALTFIDRVESGSLVKVWRQRLAEDASPSAIGEAPLVSWGEKPSSSPRTEGDHISVVKPSPLKHVPGARALRGWFETELWPLFPAKVDKLNAWRAIANISPSIELRASIIGALQRAVEINKTSRAA